MSQLNVDTSLTRQRAAKRERDNRLTMMICALALIAMATYSIVS